MRAASPSRVAIVGAGFSGTLLAVNLIRHAGPDVVLIERDAARLARGVAYAAAHRSHLLNVRVGAMSALPDEPDHFRAWMSARSGLAGDDFAPRQLYGRYLSELLDEAKRSSGGRLQVRAGDVVDIDQRPGGATLRLADRSALHADAVALTVGNLPPHTPPGLDPGQLRADAYCADPWSAALPEGLEDQDLVLIVGTGLTAVDAALLLDEAGFSGRMIAVSRRGLRPRPHDAVADPVPEHPERPPRQLSVLVRWVRELSERYGWRAAVDSLRPHTQAIWARASPAERRRFLRHLRPFWDVHRHRLAPRVDARIGQLHAEGRLSFHAGKLLGAYQQGRHALVGWRERWTDRVEVRRVRRIVNCTGPQGDLTRSADPLLCALLAKGAIRPDPLRLGLEIDALGRVIDARGRPARDLYALGPMTRGGLWEVVAVPDLRKQAWDLGRRLSNAHWVEGEGL